MIFFIKKLPAKRSQTQDHRFHHAEEWGRQRFLYRLNGWTYSPGGVYRCTPRALWQVHRNGAFGWKKAESTQGNVRYICLHPWKVTWKLNIIQLKRKIIWTKPPLLDSMLIFGMGIEKKYYQDQKKYFKTMQKRRKLPLQPRKRRKEETKKERNKETRKS